MDAAGVAALKRSINGGTMRLWKWCVNTLKMYMYATAVNGRRMNGLRLEVARKVANPPVNIPSRIEWTPRTRDSNSAAPMKRAIIQLTSTIRTDQIGKAR